VLPRPRQLAYLGKFDDGAETRDAARWVLWQRAEHVLAQLTTTPEQLAALRVRLERVVPSVEAAVFRNPYRWLSLRQVSGWGACAILREFPDLTPGDRADRYAM
jgi:hypothetical protein